MINTPEDFSDLTELFAKVREGRASSEELRQLNARLQCDARARQLWWEFVSLEADILVQLKGGSPIVDLESLFQAGETPATKSDTGQITVSSRQRPQVGVVLSAAMQVGRFVRRYPVISSSVAALFVVALIGVLSLFPPPGFRQRQTQHSVTSEFVAQLTQTHDAKWDRAQMGTTVGAHLQQGQHYKLLSGLMEIRFRSGARMVVEGPAEFTLTGPNETRLSYGKLAAEVDPNSRGFAVETPAGRVIDLGTAFGIDAPRDGSHSIHCFRGKIVYKPADRTLAPIELAASQAIRRDLDGLTLQRIKADIAQFVPDLRLRGKLRSGRHGMVVDTRFTGDVALGKPAMQSSTFGPQYAAALATDGRSTNFTHTAIEDTHPWLQVDLEQPHEIDAIIVHNRDDCCGSRLRNIVVDILASDGQTVVFTSTILNENNARKNPQWLAVGLPEATGDKVRGRYVRIRRQAEPGASGTIAQLGDWRVLSVGEVQIFADPVLKITPLEDGAEAASDAEAARNEQ